MASVEYEGEVTLKPGKERKMRNFYPWVQKGEVARLSGSPSKGGLVRLLDSDGEFIAVGHYNGASRFRFRALSLEERPIDEAFFAERFAACLERRRGMAIDSNAMRICFSEADSLPGLIIDSYDGHLAVQVRSAGMDRALKTWLPALIETTHCHSVTERSDMEGRRGEGLEPLVRDLHGQPPERIAISELGLNYSVPLKGGLKTGHYLDQRSTKARFAERVSAGERVLDCFCYSGGFAMTAAREGATVRGVDMNAEAIALAAENASANGLNLDLVEANCFDYLNEDIGDFDWIVIDPPAIAKKGSERNSLKWAIWNLVHRALPHLVPGGRMIVCSCSYQVDQRELIETARLAASDRGRRLFLEELTLQAPDHPALTQFPESLYLKCAWLRAES